jgi:hypothetical protein
MLKIEVYDKTNHLVESLVSGKSTIRIGRHSSCDLILTDPAISRFAIEIKMDNTGTGNVHFEKQNTPLTDFRRLHLGEYRIDIHNLNLLDDNDTKKFHSPRWLGLGTFLMAFVLMNSLVTIDEYLLGTEEQKTFRLIEALLMFNLILIGVTLVLAIISRAINREYRILKMASVVFTAPIGVFFISENLYGVRWLLFDFLRQEIAYQSLLWLWGIGIIFWLSTVLFDHVMAGLRYAAIALIALGVGLFALKPFLPVQNQYQFAFWEPQPILIESFKTNSVTQSQFIEKALGASKQTSAIAVQIETENRSKDKTSL